MVLYLNQRAWGLWGGCWGWRVYSTDWRNSVCVWITAASMNHPRLPEVYHEQRVAASSDRNLYWPTAVKKTTHSQFSISRQMLMCKTIAMDHQNTAWLLFRQCTSHKGLERSRASFRTPPLSNRAIHRFFNQSLCPPGCTNQRSELSSLCLDSEVTSMLTTVSCIKEQINPIKECFLNLSWDLSKFCMSLFFNLIQLTISTISRDYKSWIWCIHWGRQKQWWDSQDSFEKHCCARLFYG